MKKIIFILLSIFSISSIFANNIEATLKGNYSFNGKSFRITTVYSNNQTAYEIASSQEGQSFTARFIPNIKAGNIKVISETASGTHESTIALSDISPEALLPTEGLIARKTEQTKNVAGVNCSKILVQTKNGNQAEIWVNENGFDASLYKEIYKSDYAIQALSLLQLKGIAMEMYITNADGYTLLSFTTREFSASADLSFFK